LKGAVPTHDRRRHDRQRIDTVRRPPSLGNGPITQVLGVNGAHMKIVHRTACTPELTSSPSQATRELLREDPSLPDSAAACDATEQSSDGLVDTHKKDECERLPPDGIEFELQDVVLGALIQQIVRKDT